MKKQIMRYLMLVFALAIAAAIFWFSAQNGEKSGNSSDNLSEKILHIIGSDGGEDGGMYEQTVITLGTVLRKLAHFAEYFALGAAVCGFFATFAIKLSWCGITSFGISVLYAASDEVHQYFVPGRHASVLDVLLDSAGVLCGVLVMMGLAAIVRKRSLKKKTIKE